MINFNKYDFSIELTVRSYECDLGGVVNNSVYLQYLEHAKLEWLKSMNLDYAEIVKSGRSFVLSKLQLDFKYSLRYNDVFWICSKGRRPSLYHLEEEQDIYRSDGKLILNSIAVVAFLHNQQIVQLPKQIIEKYPLSKNYD